MTKEEFRILMLQEYGQEILQPLFDLNLSEIKPCQCSSPRCTGWNIYPVEEGKKENLNGRRETS